LTGAGYAVAMALIPGVQVNHAAHLGGLGSGALLGWALFRAGRHARVDKVVAGIAAALIVATFASIALSVASPITRRAPPASIAS
jgi:hypothetical protein